MINENNTYDPKNYEVATLKEYGFKEYKALKILWKILSKVLLIFTIFMLYFAVVIIAIQSFNASDSIYASVYASYDEYASAS